MLHTLVLLAAPLPVHRGTSNWQDLQDRVGMVTTAWSSYWIIGIQGPASFVNVPVAGIFVDINILAVTFNMLNN